MKTPAVLLTVLAALVFLTGCDFVAFSNSIANIKEEYVLSEIRYFDKDGNEKKYIFYEYNSDGAVIKVHICSSKPQDMAVELAHRPSKNKISEVSYSYYTNGVKKMEETKGWRNNSWTTELIREYDENGMIVKIKHQGTKHLYSEYYVRSFDENKRVIKEEYKRSDTSDTKERLYEYSAEGLLIKETYNILLSGRHLSTQTTTTYSYTEDRLKLTEDTTETYFAGIGVIKSQTHTAILYEWSEDRTACKVSHYNTDNELTDQYDRFYTATGELLKNQQTDGGDSAKEYVYDTDGKLISEKTADGNSITYTYEWLPDLYNKVKEARKR